MSMSFDEARVSWQVLTLEVSSQSRLKLETRKNLFLSTKYFLRACSFNSWHVAKQGYYRN